MKIISEKKITRFDDIKCGDVFLYQSDYILKIEEITDSNGDTVNAVFLDKGECGEFYGNEIVTPVDCELIIN